MHIEVLKYFVKMLTCKNERVNIINAYMTHIQAIEQILILLK